MTLSVKSLSVGYGRLQVVHDVSFSVAAGEIVALVGRNGAGKTTTLLGIAGLAKSSGRVAIADRTLVGAPWTRARSGLGMVLEGRSIFPSLTVRQNLQVGRADLKRVVELFPELASRLPLRAGVLSGGEQQMLSLARALVRRPQVLLIDEIDFGLSPLASRRLFKGLRAAVTENTMSVVLVEQHLEYAREVADRILVMNEGRIVAEMTSAELAAREAEVERIYLGGSLVATPTGEPESPAATEVSSTTTTK